MVTVKSIWVEEFKEFKSDYISDGHARWTIRLLEEKSKIVLDTPVSREAIRRALKKTNFDLTAKTIGASHQKIMPIS